ncbi:helix-hairpin-helix domain-containing protein [Lachnobacterium bovis]|uniref:Competence protein ComEA n=1 Tax=Lachnobacterium bovis TaxID=140626 RepID=A0A1H9RES5_9FIRM|nr:helix-hairpin-helix domain-containing protein [Lachnobacterium bovis]SER71154.1 competence protein ComEA [Lachnobacterium bovis]
MSKKIYTMMKKGRAIAITCFLIFITLSLTACQKEEVLISNKSSEANNSIERKYNSKSDEHKQKSESMNNKYAHGNATSNVVVYVCGQVNKPGVYQLSANKRINDAVELAGGFKPEAAVEYHNLADKLLDGQKIYVPSRLEVQNQAIPNENTSVNDQSKNVQDDGKVNLNSATKEQLMTIKGVGEKKADSIIDYRTKHGNFSKIEDLKNIAGIKDGLLNKIKDYITVN